MREFLYKPTFKDFFQNIIQNPKAIKEKTDKFDYILKYFYLAK